MFVSTFLSKRVAIWLKIAANIAAVILEFINFRYSGEMSEYAGYVRKFVLRILAKI